MLVDSGDIVRQGAFSTWAPARFRGALAGSCRHGGMQTGRPDWSADCRCQANSKVCAQHVLGRGEAHPFANHRQQQREAVHVAAAVCSTQADARTRQHTACGCQQTGFLLYLRSHWRAGRRNAQGAQVDATHRAAGLQASTARNAGGFGSRKVGACVLHTQQRLFPEKSNMTHIHITYLRTEQAGIWEVAQCKHIGKRHQQDNRYAHTHVDLQSLQHFWKFDMFICQSNVSIDPEIN